MNLENMESLDLENMGLGELFEVAERIGGDYQDQGEKANFQAEFTAVCQENTALARKLGLID